MKQLFFLFIFACFLPLIAEAQAPQLVVPSIHTSGVDRLSITPGLPYLVSAAEDAVKIWEVETGRLIRTLEGSPQEGFAAASLSPRLQWLATAGSVYERDMEPTVAPKLKLWDALTGAPIRVLHAFSIKEKVLELRFGPNQRYLMAWVVRDYSKPTTILFDPESGKQILKTPGFGSFSDTGRQIIVRQDSAVVSVDIASGYTQTIVAEPCLLAEALGGQVYLLTKTGSLLRWDQAKQSIVNNYPNILDSAQVDYLDYYPRSGNAQFSADGQLLLGCFPSEPTEENSSYRFVGFSTETGQMKCNARAQNSLAERKGIYSPDLTYFITAPITQENADNRSVMEAQRTLDGATSHSFGLQAFEKISWANKFSNLDIKVYSQGELIVVRGRSFGGWAAIFYPRLGKTVSIWEEEIDDYLQAGNHTVDERWQLLCEDYLSYQLIDRRSSDTLANLLFGENSLEKKGVSSNYTWAVTTPSGLFDASPDMMNDLHYVVGMEIIELEQLKSRFYEPGLLQKLLGLNNKPIRETEALQAVPLYPQMNTSFSEDEWQLHIQLNPRNGGIGKVSFFINGREVMEDANPQRQNSITINLKEYADEFLAPKAPPSGYGLLTATNTLTLRAYNADGWLKSAALNLPYQPPYRIRGGRSSTTNEEEEILIGDEPPSLYAIVIGTSDYAGEQIDLQFADRDAAQFHQALELLAPPIFEDRVNNFLLHTDATDPQRTALASKKEIQQRFLEIERKALPEDVVLVYLSGHGVNWGSGDASQFYYLTKDIGSEDLRDPAIRSQYAISSAELTTWINSIKAAKKVMIVDACNSGKIVDDLAKSSKDLSSDQIRAWDRMKDRTGMFILTGSAADKVSFEASRYGQGLLTTSLLRGMSGMALRGREVDVMTLFQYCRDEVPELARGVGGIQVPMIAAPTGGGESFPFGLLAPGVTIPVPQEKPVFIRNSFQDEESFSDELALGEAIGDYFRTLSIKGAQAELVYVDVSQYNDAYSINGRYTQNGNELEVTARLSQNKIPKGEAFTVKGSKTNIPQLVKDITNAATKRMNP